MKKKKLRLQTITRMARPTLNCFERSTLTGGLSLGVSQGYVSLTKKVFLVAGVLTYQSCFSSHPAHCNGTDGTHLPINFNVQNFDLLAWKTKWPKLSKIEFGLFGSQMPFGNSQDALDT